MEYNTLIQLVGQDWADFLKGFMCPDDQGQCPYNDIAAQLKTMYDGGRKVYPENRRQIFRPFFETPLKDVRVVILGTEPYPRAGYNNGLAFATDNPQMPVSLQQIYRGVEKDVYNRLDFANPQRTGMPGKPLPDGSVKYWTTQGVLLLNVALTAEEGVNNAHIDLWRPFTEYIISNLWRVKRNIVFIGIGPKAKEVMTFRGNVDLDSGPGVNVFQAFPLFAEHPVDAVKAKREWSTDVFSRTNLIIRCNNLGEPIEW